MLDDSPPLITFYVFTPSSIYGLDEETSHVPQDVVKPPGFLHAPRLIDVMDTIDTTSGGMVRKVLLKLKERSKEPFPLDDWLHYCDWCAKYTTHPTDQHVCHHCHGLNCHRSENCPVQKNRFCSFCASASKREACAHTTDEHVCFNCHERGVHLTCTALTQASSWFIRSPYCTLCDKSGSHDTNEHKCRLCSAVGQHRSRDCPIGRAPCAFCHATSHVTQEHLCHHCKKLGDHRGDDCTHTSSYRFFPKRLTDMEAKVRSTLYQMGLWSGGSQTPMTTPSHLAHPSPPHGPNHASPTTYVLSYMEGNSIVPARVLKYMRLLMHHEVPTNAFDVVVRVDLWEMKRPGMVTPQSFPTTPRLRAKHHMRMNAYTDAVLNGARMKLNELIVKQYGPQPTIV
ncbi:hypothetical protein THRCLA_08330 [Thraustotheca clavata]|uniref:Uncharacterized protein n=1 Tax=Thraustotheca clavata TaxID=74557 RepID=A0A1V9Z7K7_9STRA|nr:hypothetical protein THRCLA_08330 [Thraustotheca clavata]